jgi:hypothetical protein
MLLLGACGRDSEPLPDIEATVEARIPDIEATVEARIPDIEATVEARIIEATAAAIATNEKFEANNAALAAKAGGLTATSKEKLLALATNRDAWFLASDITTEALEGLYDSWSIPCRSETKLSDYKRTVQEIRPWFLEMLGMELTDVQQVDRYYEVESWSSPWAYVTQTWKIGDKIVLGPERQLYLLESGAWRYHDC